MASITREQYRTYGTARIAPQSYNEHLHANHPEFAAWNHRMQWYYGITAFIPIVTALLALGQFAGDHVGGAVFFYTLLIPSSVFPAIIVGAVSQRGKRRFRAMWQEQHGGIL